MIIEISGEHEAAMSSIELQRGFFEIVLKNVEALLLACRRVRTSFEIGNSPETQLESKLLQNIIKITFSGNLV